MHIKNMHKIGKKIKNKKKPTITKNITQSKHHRHSMGVNMPYSITGESFHL